MATPKRILITGASSGFGAMAARRLARDGHRVFASMRDLAAHGGKPADEMRALAAEEKLALLPVALDVTDDASVEAAVRQLLDQAGGIDVLVQNAGHMGFGPAEAFSPAQLARLYEVNVVGAHRLCRAVLPAMRAAGQGFLLWVGSSSTRGGTPPFLAPYFAAKAGMDALAQSYALELARFGIESSILVPGAFTRGTEHFAHAMAPEDAARAEAYWQGPYAGVDRAALEGLAKLEPADADPQSVAEAIAALVALPHGTRPFRRHVDPAQDGAEVVNAVADRLRAQLLERIGLADLLRPGAAAPQTDR
ncbi:oxidoreductase [Pseudoroseomonas deserti]|uniref:Oxidoreductase n=1 Tax=Teichococcus deserti TaxID=1817963 RepID=A0A1V2H9M4_9PROT|nr:SDR family oxidoreductase [Pseudoroseomonas deserti]ONG58339.1 oxidoreductase [Pseudoroseomonas deserti]